ncbi:MAG: AMP-binding protein [Euzebyales bacterium]|nr:AMP-binding protein [Euzebyales bacterium]MBA3621735.1 AMP-binding protein [Euzebyales bacterium]
MAATHGDRREALREKRYGIWQALPWAEYRRRVRTFAHGLAALGVTRGEPVAILGDNRPEWVVAELAAQSLGGMSLGLYPEGVVEEVAHVVTYGGVRVVVAEDQEQVDKLIELWDGGRLETVEWIVYYDPRGMESYDLPYLLSYPEVERRGGEHEAANPGWLDEQVAAGRSSDTAILCTTSGTTGKPKLAMLTHANLISMGRALMEIDPIEPGDEYVSFLPLAWIGEQMIALACSLQVGFALSFPEDASTVRADLREIGPRVMFSPPRIWETMLSSVQVRLDDAGWLKRAVFAWGYRIGERTADRRVRGAPLSPGARLAHAATDLVALRPVRDQLGLSRLRRAYTGGAPLGPDVFRFFHAIGVNLKQIYGQTEICGIAVAHRDGDVRFNTVGTPIPGTEMAIAGDGEVLLRSAAVFTGYYRNQEASAEALEDGWLHTGDAGYLDDDGHLIVIDRAKDVLQAGDGTRFSPAFVENKLKFSQYVEDAVVFGGGDRSYVAAIVTIDMDTVGTWAEREHMSYTTYTDLAQKAEVYELVAAHVARANDDLPEGARVRRFVLLHKQLDADDEELTRTRKVRRRVINERYGEIIAALYGDSDEAAVTATVTYQDGSTARREIRLRIQSMDDFAPPEPRRRQLAWSAGR